MKISLKQICPVVIAIIIIAVFAFHYTAIPTKIQCLNDFESYNTEFETDISNLNFEDFVIFSSGKDNSGTWHAEGLFSGGDQYADFELEATLYYGKTDQGWLLTDVSTGEVVYDIHDMMSPEEIQEDLDIRDFHVDTGLSTTKVTYEADDIYDINNDCQNDQEVQISWSCKEDILELSGFGVIYYTYKNGDWELLEHTLEETGSTLDIQDNIYTSESGSYVLQIVSAPDIDSGAITVKFLKSDTEWQMPQKGVEYTGYLSGIDMDNYVEHKGLCSYDFDYELTLEDGHTLDKTFRLSFVISPENGYSRVILDGYGYIPLYLQNDGGTTDFPDTSKSSENDRKKSFFYQDEIIQ